MLNAYFANHIKIQVLPRDKASFLEFILIYNHQLMREKIIQINS